MYRKNEVKFLLFFTPFSFPGHEGGQSAPCATLVIDTKSNVPYTPAQEKGILINFYQLLSIQRNNSTAAVRAATIGGLSTKDHKQY
jgi:hypothetical protein